MTTWEPMTEMREDEVPLVAAQNLHDLLDRECAAPVLGDAIPLLWHWLAFLPRFPQHEMGHDGHPKTGGFLPPVGERRRMYAGGSVVVSNTPVIGAPLARTSRVSGVQEKSGRSGQLLFVTVTHEIESPNGTIAEQNDLVYKAPSTTLAARTPDEHIDEGAVWGRTFAINSTVLMRFSALTYNAHRIHYDRDYATGVEGYPGLVVHGPLQAILLADAARQAFPGSRVTEFAFRSVAPAFDDQALELRARRTKDHGTVELAAYSDGVMTMTATAGVKEG